MDLSLLAVFKFDKPAQTKCGTINKNHQNNDKHIYIKEHKKLRKNRSRNSERNHSAPCDICDGGLIITNVNITLYSQTHLELLSLLSGKLGQGSGLQQTRAL